MATTQTRHAPGPRGLHELLAASNDGVAEELVERRNKSRESLRSRISANGDSSTTTPTIDIGNELITESMSVNPYKEDGTLHANAMDAARDTLKRRKTAPKSRHTGKLFGRDMAIPMRRAIPPPLHENRAVSQQLFLECINNDVSSMMAALIRRRTHDLRALLALGLFGCDRTCIVSMFKHWESPNGIPPKDGTAILQALARQGLDSSSNLPKTYIAFKLMTAIWLKPVVISLSRDDDGTYKAQDLSDTRTMVYLWRMLEVSVPIKLLHPVAVACLFYLVMRSEMSKDDAERAFDSVTRNETSIKMTDTLDTEELLTTYFPKAYWTLTYAAYIFGEDGRDDRVHDLVAVLNSILTTAGSEYLSENDRRSLEDVIRVLTASNLTPTDITRKAETAQNTWLAFLFGRELNDHRAHRQVLAEGGERETLRTPMYVVDEHIDVEEERRQLEEMDRKIEEAQASKAAERVELERQLGEAVKFVTNDELSTQDKRADASDNPPPAEDASVGGDDNDDDDFGF